MAQAQKSFQSRNNTFWNGRGKSDKEGLVLLDEALTNLIEHNNWSDLSRFVGRAGALNANDRSKVMAVVRAAVGDQITYKKDPTHETGGKISLRAGMSWGDQTLLNSYGVVRQAIVDNKGFRDAALHKELNGMKPAPAKKDVDVDKTAKHIFDYIGKTGYDKPGLILQAVEKMLRAQAAGKVVVVDGEPNH
jgi:hypothetical protein